MIPLIIQAREWHVATIAGRVREADRAELWAFACMSPEYAMREGIKRSSLAWSGLIDDRFVCMYGVVPASVIGGTGRPWMVGTDLLDRYQTTFLRRCRDQVDEMLVGFDRLENFVDSRNSRAIAWLKWLGFTFGDAVPAGPFSVPFIRFTKERNNAN